jgi:DNA polymerase/3'-5' exonuclease PolX
MKLKQAQQIAEALKAELTPLCEQIEIGGSIRRKKPEPNDIELICIPKFAEIGTGQATLFGSENTITENLLFGHLARHYHVMKMGEKYCQIATQDTKVDVFTATFRTWGYIFMLRTGPAEFSKFVVTELKKNGFTMDAGEVFHHGTPCTIPTEEDLFFLLGIDSIPPECRFKGQLPLPDRRGLKMANRD